MKTISEIASVCGVSRQAIQKRVNKLPDEFKIVKNRQIFVTEEGADKIITLVKENRQIGNRQPSNLTSCDLSTNHFLTTVATENPSAEDRATVNDNRQPELTEEYQKRIEELKEELTAARDEVKQERDARNVESEFFRKALSDRDEQIGKLLDRLQDATQALADTTKSLQAAQALQAMTMQQLEAPKADPPAEPKEEEPKGFFSWFRKRKHM